MAIVEGEAAAGITLKNSDVWRRTDVREGGHREGVHVHILVIGDDSRRLARSLTEDMAFAFPNLCLDRIDGPGEIDAYNASLGPADHVVLGLITSEVPEIDDVLARMDDMPILEPTRWLVVTDQESHSDLAKATTSQRLASVVSVPWTVPLLIGQSYSAMVRHLVADGRTLAGVRALIGPPPPNAVQGPLLEGLDLSEHEVVRQLLDGVERVLGRRPRLMIPAGTALAVQGEPACAVHLILEGDVSLHRDSSHGEVLAHLASSGPLIGLVTLARGENAFFTATTTTTARVVRLTHEQLEIVLLEEPELASPLAALAIQSLTRRLMRAEDLHLENAMLAADLEAERARLASTLEDLHHTRAELVERTRFAMLGELSAGIAHELNNPVTALARSASHLREDVERLLGASPALESARVAMRDAFNAGPSSTSDERAQVRALMDVLKGDRQLARRLMRIGITDPVQAKKLRKLRPADLELLESGFRIGASLRSVLAASERVIDLTQSLKGYARPDAADLQEVDVRSGIDDVLRLTKYKLRGIDVSTHYTDIPLVRAHPSKLQQVWTNLLVNAAEAIDDEMDDVRVRHDSGEDAEVSRGNAPAKISINVAARADNVEVTISDNGPGIPEALLEKIFEPHFTTKAGRVRFGLGMGMSIVRSIISDHDGDMHITSRPGSTVMTVTLPAVPTSTHTEEKP